MNEAPRVNLKHLRAFAAVARHGSFTRAATEIALSQPAISTLIAQLEQDLGVQLLERTTRDVRLTQAGQEFEQSANQILGDFSKAVLEAKGHAALRRGRLRIAVLPSLCQFFLPEILNEFHRKFPDVTISVLDVPANEVLSSAEAQMVDFGIGYVESADPSRKEPVINDRLVAVAACDLIRTNSRLITWKELSQYEVIAMAQGTSLRKLIDAGSLQAGVRLKIILEPRQMASAVAYARAGLGVTLLPSSVVTQSADHMVLEVVEPAIQRTISVIKRSDAALTPAATSFLELLREHSPLSSAHVDPRLRGS